MIYWEDNDSMALLRVRDFRIMTESDINKLKETMNNVKQ